MLTLVANFCVAPRSYSKSYSITTENRVENLYGPRKAHIVAVVADLLLGITLLVVALLNLTHPSLGIGLSTAAQWALIGAGATYLGVILLSAIHGIKLVSRYSDVYLFGSREDISSSSSSDHEFVEE